MSDESWDLRHRAQALMAMTDPLPRALWAEFVEAFQLAGEVDVSRELRESGLVKYPRGFEYTWQDPAARLEFEKGLSEHEPPVWRKAHEITARFFAKRQHDDDLEREVKHWLEIGERRRALQSFEKFSRTNIDAYWSPGIARAIALVVHDMKHIPAWLGIVHAKILERHGSLEKSLEIHDRLLAETEDATEFDALLKARLAASAGQIALRLGQVRRAKRFYDVGMDLMQGAECADLHVLDARLALAREDLGRARRMFRKAEKVANRSNDPAQRAEARSGLGVLAMRQGKPHEAIIFYRRSLAACRGETSRRARVLANLAMALNLTGEHEEAIELFEEAIQMRDRFGEVIGVANSLAALAQAREALHDKKGAARDLARALHLAARADDLGLVVEIHLLQTLQALRNGEVSTARAQWQKAVTLRRSMEHVDPLVLAMMEETAAELALTRRHFVKAHNHARAALRILRKNAAHYWATRCHLLLARLTFQAHRPKAALRHLETIANSIAHSKFVFPATNLPEPLLRLGLQSRSDVTKQFYQELLGHSPKTPRILPQITSGSPTVRLFDRSGARWTDERQAHLLRHHPPAILLDGPRQCLVIRGTITPVGTKRVLVQLLRLFLEHPGQSFEAWEIHREIWGQDIFDDSSALRVRVALSRLRAVIGKNVLVTLRSLSATGEITTRYGLSAQIDYATIEPAVIP